MPKKLAAAGLKEKAQALLKVLENNPYQNPPPYEKPVGDLQGALSRRINIQHRLVYEVFEVEKNGESYAYVDALRIISSALPHCLSAEN